MRRSRITRLAVLALVGLPVAAPAQAVDRSRTVTGPGGRSVQREVRRELLPGGGAAYARTIRRPGGTVERQVRVGPGGGGIAPPGVVVGREVFGPLAPPRPGTSFQFAFGALLGAPAPPPVVVAPAPVVVAPAPVVAAPGLVLAPPPVVAAAPRADPYADALGRLSSRHAPSRRDGALTLGMIKDPRAVPALVDLLQHDWETDVRVASARALGAIGDPKAAGPLEEAARHDRNREVRQAAAQAFARLPQPSRGAEGTASDVSGPPPSPSASPWKREATPPPSPEPAFVPPDSATPALSGPADSP